MRKVVLTMEAQVKYETIKKVVEQKLNRRRAAVMLEVSERTIRRYIRGYRESGKAFFVHGNTGKASARAVPEDICDMILRIYNNVLDGCNFQFFHQLLTELEPGFPWCIQTVRNILLRSGRHSPKMWKSTRKRLQKEKRQAEKANAAQQDLPLSVEPKLTDPKAIHPTQPRPKYDGELLQMDASGICAPNGEMWQLHQAYDAHSKRWIGAWFDYQETLSGYYHVLAQVLRGYGIPYLIRTDGRTVFEYHAKNASDRIREEDTLTQFAYACKQLGIELESTSVPQKKGGVERLNQTAQGQITYRLKMANITDINVANAMLPTWIDLYNQQFALPFKDTTSCYDPQISEEQIDRTLAVLSTRKVTNGHDIVFFRKKYFPVDSSGETVYLEPKQEVVMVQSYSGSLYLACGDTVYATREIPEIREVSENFDFTEEQPPAKEKKIHIPSMNHCWRHDSVEKHFAEFPKGLPFAKHLNSLHNEYDALLQEPFDATAYVTGR